MASALALAIERKSWTLAALCLLVGLAEVASRLPPEALEELIELLEEPPRGRRTR